MTQKALLQVMPVGTHVWFLSCACFSTDSCLFDFCSVAHCLLIHGDGAATCLHVPVDW